MCTSKSSRESEAALCGEYLVLKDGAREKAGKDKPLKRPWFWQLLNEIMEELLSLGEITWPLVITGLLLYSKSPVSMHFLGCLGDIELAGGSLAIGFANITGYSVMKGLSMGMEPICIQAFGAKKWNLLGQAFKKTVLLLLLTSVPIALLWFHMETILLWLGQDPDITSMASVYLTFCLPDLLAQAVLHPLRIFLRSQGLTRPLTLAAAIAFILHIPINYFLVIHHNLGVKGVALASAWTTLNINLILLAYLAFSDTALKPWVQSKEFNQRLQSWTLLAMATSSAVSVCLEWWWYEVMLILCGRLSTPSASVAAMGILIQTTGLIYVVPSSLSSGISTRVGHELGAGWPARAQWAAAVGLVVSAACGLMAFLFTTMVRDTWGKIFTADPQILSLVSMALPIVGFCELGNCPQTAGCGVLTGSARPKAAASINFSAFYVIGLPVAVLLSFGLKMGFLGLWFGLVAAQVSCMCMMAYVVARTDWKLQADRARQLTEAAGADDKINKLETGLLA